MEWAFGNLLLLTYQRFVGTGVWNILHKAMERPDMGLRQANIILECGRKNIKSYENGSRGIVSLSA